jgi:hypothetical protein
MGRGPLCLVDPVSGAGCTSRRDMPGERGSITITGEEAPHQNASIRFRMAAVDLPRGVRPPLHDRLACPRGGGETDLRVRCWQTFASCDPFILIQRVTEDFGGVKVTPCYKTEVRCTGCLQHV